MRDSSTHLDFDLELAKQQSQENPVYYVQYAHARIASLLRVAASRGIECPRPSQATLALLDDPDELALIRKLSAFPVVMEASAGELEPHRMAYYLRELAGMVHPFTTNIGSCHLLRRARLLRHPRRTRFRPV